MDSKKISAALAAVTAYIKTQEEAAVMASQASGDHVAAPSLKADYGHLNLWGTSGRQSVMQMRGLMQMKSFHRIK